MDAPAIIPDAYSRRFSRFFGGYTGWLLGRKFFAVRMAQESSQMLEEFDRSETPLIVVFNHASWWDPIVAQFLARRFMPSRQTLAAMDRTQLARFGFFRKIGCFGIDPDDPAVLEPMTEFVRARMQAQPSTAFWVTGQGRFTDVRAPIRLRPGAAALAASMREAGVDVDVLVICFEYTFWQDARPEVFVNATHVRAETERTTGWLRAMTREMEECRESLASMVIARDPSAFEAVLGAGAARINPLYDLWLRARGKGGAVPGDRTEGAGS